MLKNVYCYQVGSADCYKAGVTRHEPEKRKRGFSTGSPTTLVLHRTVQSEEASRLEKYIHHLLDLKRAENGEFFYVSRPELDDAVDRAVAFIGGCLPLLHESRKLSKKRPNGTMLEPPDGMLEVYRELREAERDRFLLDRQIEFLESKVQVIIGENSGITGIASWEWEDRSTEPAAFQERASEALREIQARLWPTMFQARES